MASPFNAAAALAQQVKGVELDTRMPTIPEGEWMAQCMKMDASVRYHEKFNPPHGLNLEVDLTWEIVDQEVRDATTMDHPQVHQRFFLDVDPIALKNGQVVYETGRYKNVRLGAVLAAVGLNRKAGWSINDILNQLAYVRVRHRQGDDGETYSEVRAVASLDEGDARRAKRQEAQDAQREAAQ